LQGSFPASRRAGGAQ